jgi:hypothetical protein
MMHHVCLATAFVLGLSASAQAQERLEWKLKKGDTFFVETTTTSQGTFGAGGKKTTVDSTSTSVVSFRTVDATAKGYVIEQEFQLMRERSPGASGRSAEAFLKGRLEPVIEGAVKKGKGAILKILLQSNGQLKLSGYEALVQRVAGKNDRLRALVRELTPKEYWQGFAEDIFRVVPATPVKRGDKWERTSALASAKMGLGALGSFGAKYQYLYKNKTRAGVEIAVAADMKYAAPAASANGLPFKIVGGAIEAKAATGSALFDAEAGRLVRSAIEIHFQGDLTVEIGGKKTTLRVDQRQTIVSRVLASNPLGP